MIFFVLAVAVETGLFILASTGALGTWQGDDRRN